MNTVYFTKWISRKLQVKKHALMNWCFNEKSFCHLLIRLKLIF